MYSNTLSSNIAQLEKCTYPWPETTKAFVVATRLVGTGEGARIELCAGELGLTMSARMHEGDCSFLAALCHYTDGDTWTTKHVVEMLVGRVGVAQIAVYRDEEGYAFCPDAPDVPFTSVADLLSVAIAVGAERTRPRGVMSPEGKLIREPGAAAVPAA